MSIDSTQHSNQFSGFSKSAADGLIGGCPEHSVPLRQLLDIQLASFSWQVDIRGPGVVLHDASAICFATLINELAVNAARCGASSPILRPPASSMSIWLLATTAALAPAYSNELQVTFSDKTSVIHGLSIIVVAMHTLAS